MANILIVENSIELREALVDLLELEGHTAFWSENDNEVAWEVAIATVPDLIIQDLSALNPDRFTLLSRLRQNVETAKIPVIFMMHYLTQAEVALSNELGANGCLLKPFDTEVLLDLVRRYTSRLDRELLTLSVTRNLSNYR